MIKILAACGAGVNSSHQIKSAIEEEMANRGYRVEADAVMVKDITEEMISQYDVFTPISEPDLGYEIKIPVVEAGPILYRIPSMAQPVYDELEEVIKKLNK
ncbi:PTS sugar transporter subunit IIB [Clostridium sp. P21]|uniref:PTS sugar transporter subunit IIB n=1 Tax=Clostridium muellerianum TaxID=2716538 RepID=A0A7Y0ELJ2_9CLOT|nr:PTS sugar transporter subunit IIB [Clostridium muellerianum]NMM65337.1 PTS sugar transporter subunit IIB [Clostridium muellerianum]